MTASSRYTGSGAPAAPSAEIDLGYRAARIRWGRFSDLIGIRSVAVGITLTVATLILAVFSLGLGTYSLSVSEVLEALFYVDGDQQARMVVLQWRLPRALFAIACGVALAISGAIFQSLTRNPLGSPDVIGFSTGAYTGAIIVMLWFGSTRYLEIAGGSLIGGCLTAAVVYMLAMRRGTVGTFRLIIMGIGVAALLSSVNSLLFISTSVDQAMLAAVWAAGSLGGLGNEQLVPMVAVLCVLLAFVAVVARGLAQLELGDDAARMLGVRTNRVRATAVIVGVALTALVTAAAGPISFIALAAPQIARRLVGGSGLTIIPAACVGAFILLVSDVAAQRAGYPVGVITVVVGGGYLAWLLFAEYRRNA